MRSEIMPSGGGVIRRVSSSTAREIAAVDGTALVRAAKVRGAQFVGHTALQAVAELSMTQTELEKIVPQAALRLSVIADGTTAAIQAIVLRMGAEL